MRPCGRPWRSPGYRDETAVASWRWGGHLWFLLLALLGVAALHGSPAAGLAQEGAGAVYVVPVTGTIDLGLAPYLERVLDDAADDGAAAVLLVIDTPGGRLDAVLQMRDALLGSTVPTIAYVDRTAFSAGALVAIACEQIYFAPGGVMGAATPVSGATGETADEKTVSAVRSTFGATAEERGRDPLVAEAMVDPAVVIDGLTGPDDLLTLTAEQAIDWGYSEGTLDTREDVLAAAGLAGAPVIETSPSFAERIVRFLTDPVVASLLLLAGLILLVGDFFVEGIGIGAVAGLALLALFFYGHMLAGLAGWEDVALVLLGIALIAVELFVIPGFGIPGVLGLIAIGAGLFLAMVGRDIRTEEATEQAMLVVAVALGGLVLATIAIFALVPRSRTLGRLVLQSTTSSSSLGEAVVARNDGKRGWLRWFGSGGGQLERVTGSQPPEQEPPDLVGRPRLEVGTRGVALSDLRPAGIAEFERDRFDAVTSGEYIAHGEPVEVVRDEQYRLIVRRARDS
jgi:membrane-bound serine protease (ClpP class)